MGSIVQWLDGLGLSQYAAAFVAADIDPGVLPELTEADLAQLGVTLGHRKILLRSIAAEAAGREPARGREPDVAPAATAAPAAERRQVTVMFCDLVGLAELGSSLDPEDLQEVIGRCHACIAQTMARFDGFEAKYMGDRVLAYFGYPQAREDDAERAVRAGLALVDAIDELRSPERLRARIGIATGLVVIGDPIGQGAAQELAIIGETPNLAARLQALAKPSTVVIDEGTRTQIGALFDLIELGPQQLRGFSEPHHAWRVLVENPSLGRFEALRSRATPLIGRAEDLDLLSRRWAQARAGGGRVVLISGEPGVGKSRLAETLAQRIRAERHLRLDYFCSPHHQDSALFPVIAHMERAAGFARDDTTRRKLVKLEAYLASIGLAAEDIALIAELHCLPSAGLAPPLNVSPQRRKEKTFEALLRYIEQLARQNPVLLMFEDIHWIDPSSRELLDLAIGQMAAWPVLLMATFRPEFQTPWTGHPHVTILALSRLDRQHTATMVESIAGKAALPASVVEQIAERTDGVPLFVEEVTKAVLEAGVRASAALPAAPHSAQSVPAALQALLMARLDRLGREAMEVAQWGAVIGRKFGYELLRLIATCPEPQLRDALDRLTDAGLLFARGVPPQSSYLFKHALVQDAAYGTLLRTRRQDLHLRIASVLEERFPEMVAAQPEVLAHHVTEAGLAERAVTYWMKAGGQALARSAMAEAEALLRKGLSLVPSIPEGPSRWHSELQLQIALGRTLMASQGYSAIAMGQAYDRARALCELLNRPPELWAVLIGLHSYHQDRADLLLALKLAEEMQELGEIEDNATARLTGCRLRGWTSLLLGEFDPARALLEQSLALYDASQHPINAELGSPFGALPTVLGHLSWALALLGHLDQALIRNDSAIAEARRLNHAPTLANALSVSWRLGWLVRSDPVQLLHCADQLMALSIDYGLYYWNSMALAWRGWSLAALGQSDEAIPMITKAFTTLSELGATIYKPRLLTLLAEAHGMAGQPDVGLARLDELDGLTEGRQVRWCLAETLRIRGDLLLQSRKPSEAEASFRESVALARRQNAKLFELRSATSLARLWTRQGRVQAAHDLLTPGYGTFTEGFDARDLIEARELLDDGPRSSVIQAASL